MEGVDGRFYEMWVQGLFCVGLGLKEGFIGRKWFLKCQYLYCVVD